MDTDIANYNTQLAQNVRNLQANYTDLGGVAAFDTQPIFNSSYIGRTFGFVNVTGSCAAYENGTPTSTCQAKGRTPVSNYFWLDTLHPLSTVHNIPAEAVSIALAGHSATQVSTISRRMWLC